MATNNIIHCDPLRSSNDYLIHKLIYMTPKPIICKCWFETYLEKCSFMYIWHLNPFCKRTYTLWKLIWKSVDLIFSRWILGVSDPTPSNEFFHVSKNTWSSFDVEWNLLAPFIEVFYSCVSWGLWQTWFVCRKTYLMAFEKSHNTSGFCELF